MIDAGKGLSAVSTEDLKKALKGLHRATLPTPLTIEGLTRNGLQHCAQELLAHLRGLGEDGVRAVLVAVHAERG